VQREPDTADDAQGTVWLHFESVDKETDADLAQGSKMLRKASEQAENPLDRRSAQSRIAAPMQREPDTADEAQGTV
jgi:hypothetical protein